MLNLNAQYYPEYCVVLNSNLIQECVMMSVKSCLVSLGGSVFNDRSVTELMEETPQLSGAQARF